MTTYTAADITRSLAGEGATERVRTCRHCGFVGIQSLFKTAGNGFYSNTCRKCHSDICRKRNQDPVVSARRNETTKAWRTQNRDRCREAGRRHAASETRREKNRVSVALYKERHPERASAHTLANCALNRGDLARSSVCEVVGCDVSRRIHMHHEDYTKPLDIIWLCAIHHKHVHHVGPLLLKSGGFVTAPSKEFRA